MVWVIFKGPDYITTVELEEMMARPDPNPTNVPERSCCRAVGDSSCHRMSVGDWLRSCEKTEWVILRRRGPLRTQTHAGHTGSWWFDSEPNSSTVILEGNGTKGVRVKRKRGGRWRGRRRGEGTPGLLTTENVLSKGHKVTYSPGRVWWKSSRSRLLISCFGCCLEMSGVNKYEILLQSYKDGDSRKSVNAYRPGGLKHKGSNLILIQSFFKKHQHRCSLPDKTPLDLFGRLFFT